MPQLDISTYSSQLFWLAISFVFLYFIVQKLIVPKAEKIILRRDDYLQKNIVEAEEFNDSAKSLDIEINDKISKVKAQVEEIHNTAKEGLEKSFSLEEGKISSDLAKNRKLSASEIENYITSFKQDQGQYCVKIAAFIIEKLTDKKAEIPLLKEIYKEIK